MAHYNLYDSLSLDPTADSSQLVADIDAKLAQLSPCLLYTSDAADE